MAVRIRSFKSKKQSDVPSRCWVCNAVLNYKNDTDICMHGHKNDPRVVQQRKKEEREDGRRERTRIAPTGETPPE